MTHDELLAKLWILPADVTEQEHGTKAVNALRAVVELHQLRDDNSCQHCVTWYPCDTIQVIEKELR